MEQRKFLAMVGPLAQADMQKSGILASLTIAQAILESGWGTSELATKANALFGIKADARWSGRAYSKKRFVVELLEANGITVTPEINAFIEAAVKELDLAEKNAIGEIGKIFSDAEQTPQN